MMAKERTIEDYIQSALLWRKECITLRSKSGVVVPYQDSPARQEVRRYLRVPGHYAVLKARQMGVSVEVTLGALHRCMFRPGSNCAIAAHTADAAKKLLRDFHDLYQSQPEWIKAHCRIVSRNTTQIEFDNGSKITANSASSESWRSKTFSYLHLSEVAHYPDYTATMQAILQTAAPEAIVVYETTPKGPNEFHAAWSDPFLRWRRIFLPWTSHPEYTSTTVPPRIPPQAREYIQEHGLTKEQANWFVHALATRCNNNLDTFKQEFPIDAQSCFLTSGRRFFHAQLDDNNGIIPPNETEIAKYANPHPDHRYAVGVDGASGSPTGDYSALVILDVTNPTYTVALRYAARLPPNQWAEVAAKLISPYKRRAVIVESNHVGVAIAETLAKAGVKPLRNNGKLAWTTTAQSRPKLLATMHAALVKHKLDINDPLIAQQCNSFVYNDKGKPEAAGGKHDDLVFATALALQAAPHVPSILPVDPSKEWTGGLTVQQMVARDIRNFQAGITQQQQQDQPWNGL